MWITMMGQPFRLNLESPTEINTCFQRQPLPNSLSSSASITTTGLDQLKSQLLFNAQRSCQNLSVKASGKISSKLKTNKTEPFL